MNPVTFPEANKRYGPPEGMTEAQVMTLAAWEGRVKGGGLDGAPVVVTAWQPTAEELATLNAGGPLYLSFIGGLPPHFPTVKLELAMQGADNVQAHASRPTPQEPVMPGAWTCEKCGFVLQKNVIVTRAGKIYADPSPLNEVCPNDGTLMKPLTWRKANDDLFSALMDRQTQLDDLTGKLEVFTEQVRSETEGWLDGAPDASRASKMCNRLYEAATNLLAAIPRQAK